MSVELLLSIIGAVASILYGFWLIANWGLAQFDKRLDERFRAQEEARKEGSRLWNDRLHRMETRQERTEDTLNRLLIDLPDKYVRREDWVRSQSVLEGKIDGLALKIENALLKGGAS